MRLSLIPREGISWVVRRVTFLLVLFAGAFGLFAGEGRVIKVLPEFIDLKGRASVSPSLYDRDAYQHQLRLHPARRSGIRYYTQWKVKPPVFGLVKLRLELRGAARGDLPRQKTLEQSITPGGRFSHWTTIELAGTDYREFGEVTAWRMTLWEGDQLLGEQKSFLW